eukprot:gnl/TRDRNA2_/TRDRNA2_163196_c0_seq7.p1 gnl/TRDRNA2_/TRDRNA2_163196_c0~~gnl/TRDRNA2_/TRDRNA2_163196_c0_seq7.p1  ORF type:complete len:145 (-),score=6.32 gnl/TRDRNA2_/TRDRNA2_163196_c0_seq7:71-505(-)
MCHRLFRQDPCGMVVYQQSINEVNDFGVDEVRVFRGHKFGPSLPRMPTQDVVKVRVQFQVVFVQICEQAICAENPSYFDKLVVVVVTCEATTLKYSGTWLLFPKPLNAVWTFTVSFVGSETLHGGRQSTSGWHVGSASHTARWL